MDNVNLIFDQLDDWRHLPTYQLERRADIFFSLYLRRILQRCTGRDIHNVIIPEFPLRKGTLIDMKDNQKGRNQSYRADYLAFSSDLSQTYLVELKTDRSSSREVQRLYLKTAAEQGLNRLMEGLHQVFRATNSKRKYFCLFKKLELLNLVDGLCEMEKVMASKGRLNGFSDALAEIKYPKLSTKTSLVCIHPSSKPSKATDKNGNSDENTFDNWVSLEEVIGIVNEQSDPISQRFAKSLKYWSHSTAGSRIKE